MDRITSRQNAVVRRFRALARTSPTGEGEVLLDGEHLLEEALASAVPVDIAAFSDEHLAGGLAAIAGRLAAAGTRIVAVSKDVLAAMSPVREPSGAVAIARVRPASVAAAFDAPAPLVLVLGGVQDPGNVGAIIRAAAAFGATAVIASAGTANPFGWKALRGAMGGTFRLPIVASAPLDAVVSAARDARVPIIAMVPRGGTLLPAARLDGGCVLAVGGEGGGIPDALLEAAAVRLTIPMHAPVESLNVATAAALVLYEAARQRAEMVR